ncbi:unnamed protein product [Closterium sp. NIES-64]|nr:unnamed protein product [Closterium sp. NIES-64]
MHVWEGRVWRVHVGEGRVWRVHVGKGRVWRVHVWEGRVWRVHVGEGRVWRVHVGKGRVWRVHVGEGRVWRVHVGEGRVWRVHVWEGRVWRVHVGEGRVWRVHVGEGRVWRVHVGEGRVAKAYLIRWEKQAKERRVGEKEGRGGKREGEGRRRGDVVDASVGEGAERGDWLHGRTWSDESSSGGQKTTKAMSRMSLAASACKGNQGLEATAGSTATPVYLTLHWKTASATKVNLALEAAAGSTAAAGWFSLAWSADGRMAPADAVIGNLPGGAVAAYYMSGYAMSDVQPTSSFDIGNAVQTTSASGSTVIEFSRMTGDGAVPVNVGGSNTLIWAFSEGGSQTLGFHGENDATKVNLALEAAAGSTAAAGWFSLAWSADGRMAPADAVIGNLPGGAVAAYYMGGYGLGDVQPTSGFSIGSGAALSTSASGSKVMNGALTLDFSCATSSTGGGSGGGIGGGDNNGAGGGGVVGIMQLVGGVAVTGVVGGIGRAGVSVLTCTDPGSVGNEGSEKVLGAGQRGGFGSSEQHRERGGGVEEQACGSGGERLRGVEEEQRIVVYRGRWMRGLRLMVRLKVAQLVGVASLAVPIAAWTQGLPAVMPIASPPSFSPPIMTLTAHQASLPLGTSVVVAAVVGGAAAASACLWFYSSRYVGEMALIKAPAAAAGNGDGNGQQWRVCISTLDFWGNRDVSGQWWWGGVQQQRLHGGDALVPPLKGLSQQHLKAIAHHSFVPLDVPAEHTAQTAISPTSKAHFSLPQPPSFPLVPVPSHRQFLLSIRHGRIPNLPLLLALLKEEDWERELHH